MLCSEIVKVNANHIGGQARLLKCKRWSCEICRPDNRRRVIRLAAKGQPDKFMTLTSKAFQYETPDIAAQAMRDAFARLIRLMRKRFPSKTLEYMRVFEATKSGWPHLHILLRAPFIPQRWLSAAWNRLLGSKIVDIRPVGTGEGVANYVSKYIGKDVHRFAGVTRWFRSKGWSLPEDDQDPPLRFGQMWETSPMSPKDFFWRTQLRLKAQGAILEEIRVGYMQWRWPMRRET